jgi:ABC-type oligopeptide transport system substrate-binding subunit
LRNYTGYCNPEVDKLIEQESAEPDREKRKQLVWQIERRLAEDGARPIIFYPRGATYTQTLFQRARNHGQPHLQPLSHGRRLARQIAFAYRR